MLPNITICGEPSSSKVCVSAVIFVSELIIFLKLLGFKITSRYFRKVENEKILSIKSFFLGKKKKWNQPPTEIIDRDVTRMSIRHI